MTPPDPGFVLTLDGLYKFVQTIVVPILGYGAYILRDIRHQLRTINGRVMKLEAWTTAHEKIDDDRTKALKRELDQIQHGLRDRGGGP